jgi:hypothetical protein
MTISHVRHVFDRNDARNHALVAMPAGHLVARLQAALDGDVHLDHLLHARRQFVALGELLALFLEGDVEFLASLLETLAQRFQLLRDVLVGHPDIEPVMRVDAVEVFLGDQRALGQPFRSAIRRFADDHPLAARAKASRSTMRN